jgi:hypothetical protein
VDGTKRPLGTWKQYQTDRPELLDVDSWFANWPNLGLVCGQVSGRLECLDFEGRFMERVGIPGIRSALGPLANLFDSWCEGYCERTPSNGMHVLVRLEGAGPLPGNTKIALDPTHETLIETRGEGGFIITAPSNGATHESGDSWRLLEGGFDSIAYATLHEWQSVLDALGQFDRSPPAPPPPPIRPIFTGTGWINDFLATLPPVSVAMNDVGWVYVRSDNLGQLWRRPGKDLGVSGRLNLSGRLHVFSTSTPLTAGTTTYDHLDVVLAYELGRPPTQAERVEWGQQARAGASNAPGPLTPAAAGGNPTGATPSLHLPDELWQAIPHGPSIFEATAEWGAVPDATLAHIMCAVGACIHPRYLLPRLGTLDFIALAVGVPGSCKSTSKRCAEALMPELAFEHERVGLWLAPGSGEGFAEAYIERGSKNLKQTGLARDGAMFYADEGEFITKVAQRSGNTVMPTLRQAYMGELTGQMNANAVHRRVLPARGARFTMMMSITPEDAGAFLTPALINSGFPQRLMWVHTTFRPWRHDDDPVIPRLDIPLRLAYHPDHAFKVDPLVYKAMRETAERAHAPGGSPLDAHIGFGILKMAAILAAMGDSWDIGLQYWEPASTIMDTSRNVRHYIQASAAARADEHHYAAGRGAAIRDDARLAEHLNNWIDVLEKAVRNWDGEMPMRKAKDRIAQCNVRHGISRREVIEGVLGRGRVMIGQNGGLVRRGGVSGVS